MSTLIRDAEQTSTTGVARCPDISDPPLPPPFSAEAFRVHSIRFLGNICTGDKCSEIDECLDTETAGGNNRPTMPISV